MNTQEAVAILRSHNAWRTDNGGFAHSPAQITEAIDHVCDVLDVIQRAAKTLEYTDFCFTQFSAADWQAWMEFDRKDWPE